MGASRDTTGGASRPSGLRRWLLSGLQAFGWNLGDLPFEERIDPRDRPRTVKQAVERLMECLPDQKEAHIQGLYRRDLIHLHHGFGTRIRNRFGLWRGNVALREATARLEPDGTSMAIAALWQRLQQNAPTWRSGDPIRLSQRKCDARADRKPRCAW